MHRAQSANLSLEASYATNAVYLHTSPTRAANGVIPRSISMVAIDLPSDNPLHHSSNGGSGGSGGSDTDDAERQLLHDNKRPASKFLKPESAIHLIPLVLFICALILWASSTSVVR
ncbi:uncharacterized protein LOC112342161 [Selaginella moellendorffii]|uniref:uncharacterized protein LOC112342161 n=1 Tax=Selaginella moellendorffii TaxID=88036 RepID=UPI000D1CD68A|nr:uncharacterized protein LOC112342161 [Selaginella moellendorffii]|eukprot:XP_024519304.1 uncharacterized protein LOC112342161 [Selaginella moellendorffii]